MLQFAYLVSLYHHYHLLQQEHGKLEALELFSLAHRYSRIMCCQTLLAVAQAIAEERSREGFEMDSLVCISTFIEQRLTLGFLGLNVFKLGL